MDPLTRWEASAITNRGRRPRPGTGRGADVDLREPRPPEPPPEPPADSLLVPLDAWNRMLKQLGNLHEAGRELAEARERAAKAETEADFLRERVADLRERLDTAERMATEPPSASEVPSETAGSPSPLPALHPLAVARTVYGGWRSRLGRWIEPSSSGP